MAKRRIGKKRSGGGRGRKRTVDAVSVQIAVILDHKLKKKYKLSRKVLEQAVMRKAEGSAGIFARGHVVGAREGPNPKGMKLLIKKWRNPSRRGHKAAWRTGTQADAWGSLRGLLRSARIVFK